MTLLLATGNPGKVADFAALGLDVHLLPGFHELPGVEENGASFEANARIKAEHYSQCTAGTVLADDSGLEVDALGGAPGIYSARFAGTHGDDAANNRLLLERLRGCAPERRGAQFVCCLAVARAGRTLATFFGAVPGRILEAPSGGLGFGYDPVFYSLAAERAFGELTPAEKAPHSHRGHAARALLAWLASSDARVVAWPPPAKPTAP